MIESHFVFYHYAHMYRSRKYFRFKCFDVIVWASLISIFYRAAWNADAV